METQWTSPILDALTAAPTSSSESMTDKNQAWARAKKVLSCRPYHGRTNKIVHLWEVRPKTANITAPRGTTRFKSSRINLNIKASMWARTKTKARSVTRQLAKMCLETGKSCQPIPKVCPSLASWARPPKTQPLRLKNTFIDLLMAVKIRVKTW